MKKLFFATVATIAAPALAQTMTPAGFVAQAGASDLYERTSSELVLQTSKNPKVRAFAQTMIRDHAKSTADVKAAAAKAGVKVAPPTLMKAQTDMVAKLRAASGTARDQAYIAQQRTAHEQALALHKGYAANGTAAPLKAVAAATAPVVQHHLSMLQSM